MNEFNKYVGLDVHKETIAVSVAEGNGGQQGCFIGEVANTPEALEKLIRQLRKGGRTCRSVTKQAYGYGIYRQLQDLGWMSGHRAVADSEESWGSGQDGPAR